MDLHVFFCSKLHWSKSRVICIKTRNQLLCWFSFQWMEPWYKYTYRVSGKLYSFQLSPKDNILTEVGVSSLPALLFKKIPKILNFQCFLGRCTLGMGKRCAPLAQHIVWPIFHPLSLFWIQLAIKDGNFLEEFNFLERNVRNNEWNRFRFHR
jgi:hypothetical protein